MIRNYTFLSIIWLPQAQLCGTEKETAWLIDVNLYASSYSTQTSPGASERGWVPRQAERISGNRTGNFLILSWLAVSLFFFHMSCLFSLSLSIIFFFGKKWWNEDNHRNFMELVTLSITKIIGREEFLLGKYLVRQILPFPGLLLFIYKGAYQINKGMEMWTSIFLDMQQ